MSALEVDGRRPAVAWVVALPRDWLTPAEREVLLCIALDSYDGVTARPGYDDLGAWTGKHPTNARNTVAKLCKPTDKRPALLRREKGKREGHRVTLVLLKPDAETSATDRSLEPESDEETGQLRVSGLADETEPQTAYSDDAVSGAEAEPQTAYSDDAVSGAETEPQTAYSDDANRVVEAAKPRSFEAQTAYPGGAPPYPLNIPPPYARARVRGGAGPKLRGRSAAVWGETVVESVHRLPAPATDRAPTGDGELGNQDQKRREEKLRREAALGPPCKHCPEPEYRHLARAVCGEDTHDFEAAS